MEISVYKNTSWKTLPWNQFRRKVFNLQCRIYDAIRKDDIKKAIKLQKCLINSSYSHYLAIRELTEINKGKKFPGSDGKLMLTCKEKAQFATRIAGEIKNWNHSPVRKINIINNVNTFISKPFFCLSTVEDRIIQFIWKLALEPAHEATFLQTSYGFRIGKTAWDIQKYLIYDLKKLRKQPGRKFLTIEFGNFLTLVDHKFILNKIVFPYKQKVNVYRALKMGILEGSLLTFSYHYSITNLCFLLLNIAFHGLDEFQKNLPTFSNTNNRLTAWSLRYGSHLFYSFNEDEEKLLQNLDTFLYPLGFDLKLSKIKVFNSLHNFDFLDWSFVIKPTRKIITYPAKYNWLIYKTEVKLILKNSNYNIETRIEKIRLKTSIWYSYHCFCDFSKVNSLIYTLKNWVNKYLRFHTRTSKTERSILLDRGFSFVNTKID
jgi:hypothetical protein